MLYIGMIICILSSLMIYGYKWLVEKKTEDFRISVKDTIILTSISAVLQMLLVVFNYEAVFFGMYIPYLIIQGYTDFKTGYVYRITSIIYIAIALINLGLTYKHISIPHIAICLIFSSFFVICSLFKSLGWGDTITIIAIEMILMIVLRNAFIGGFILIMCLVSFLFSAYTIITKKKSAPFLPWLTSVTMLVILIYNMKGLL